MIAFLIANRYLVGGIALAAFILGGYFYIRNDAYKDGEKHCETKYNEAFLEAQKTSIIKINKLEKTYEQKIRSIQAQGDSGFGVGPRTSNVLDQLRSDYDLSE